MDYNEIHYLLFLESTNFKRTTSGIIRDMYHFPYENKEIIIKNFENIIFHHCGTIYKIVTYYYRNNDRIEIVIYDEMGRVDRFFGTRVENITDITIKGEKTMNVKKYVKKPIPVEAQQYMDDTILEFTGDNAWVDYVDRLWINTLEGQMRCKKGDYVIKGINGEFYPCKKDIFEESYEEYYDDL